jgi:Hypothetical protein (DUF2513)
MKRDMELIRELMLAIESRDDTEYWVEDLEISGDRDIAEIKGHLQLLVDAGFIKATVNEDQGSRSPYILIDRMLHNGHEFLDNARNEPVWKGVMKQVQEKGGSISIAILTQLLIAETKRLLGLS